MGLSIDYPSEIKYFAAKGHIFDANTGRLLRKSLLKEQIILTDAKYTEARNALLSFVSSYNPDNQGPTAGYTKVKEYKNNDGAFLFAQDKIAPNSIVVTRNTGETTNAFYISDSIGKYGEPLIFNLSVRETPEGPTPPAYQVNIANVLWENPEMVQKANSTLFSCNGETTSVEVWKTGKSMPEPLIKQRSRANPAPLKPLSIPVGI